MSTINWLFGLVITGGLLLSGLAAPPRQDATTTPSVETPTVETPAVDPSATAEPTLPFFPSVWVSPTPDATGAIIVLVQPGESLWVIAARAGLSLPELLALNNLTEQSIINPGDALIIGYGTPEAGVAPEAGAAPTDATPATPTATLPPPTPQPTERPREAAICLTAFDDLNRNGIHDPGEPLRAGVAFTVYNTEAVVANYITDGRSEPRCLGGLVPGDYRVTRSIAPGELLTTGGDWLLSLTAGGELYQAFGSVIEEALAQATNAARPTAAQTPTPSPTDAAAAPQAGNTGGNLLFRLFGVVVLFLGGLLLLGAVLILLIRQSRNLPATKPPEKGGERHFQNIDDLE